MNLHRSILSFIALTLISIQSTTSWVKPAIAQQQIAPNTSSIIESRSTQDDVSQIKGNEIFIENVGQFAPGARFKLNGDNADLWLASDAIWLTVLEEPRPPSSPQLDTNTNIGPTPTPNPEFATDYQVIPQKGINLKLSFINANTNTQLEPFDQLDTAISYLSGNDPTQWHVRVPVWSGVRYRDLYPGVNLEIGGQNNLITWQFAFQQDADPDLVQLKVEGAEVVTVDNTGRLLFQTILGSVVGPTIVSSDSHPMQVIVENDLVRFAPSQKPENTLTGTPLELVGSTTTDGVLVYSTYLGGTSFDAGQAVASGIDGAAFVTGETYSLDFPTTPGVFDPSANGSYDTFVTKIQGAGDQLAFSTFLGGNGDDRGYAIATDESGSAYVVGSSTSTNFPITIGTFDTSYNGSFDVFVAKLTATGDALLFSSYLGGSGGDYGDAVAVDAVHAVYITGETRSTNFPTTPDAFDTSWNGGYPYGDGFVTKMSPDGSALIYSTYLGASGEDDANAIAIDDIGEAIVTGWTGSSTFPTTPGAFDTTFAGMHDVFITKLNQSGSGLIYSGLLGGSMDDQGQGIAVDIHGQAYVTGQTNSSNFTVTPNAYDTSLNGTWDGFVTKVSATGDSLIYSTFIGGSSYDCETVGIDRECVIATDNSGVAYIAGRTSSTDFPTTDDGFDRSYNGNEDGFVVKLSPDGSSLVYGSFFGGSAADQTLSVAVDYAGAAYASGRTYSSDFPTTEGAFDITYNGGVDSFVINLPVGSGLPPNPQGNLQLHMPDAIPPDAPIRPVVTVVNIEPVPAHYTVIVQLWRGFGKLAEQSQDVWFVSFGRQQITFDFGIYEPSTYWIKAELWEGGNLLTTESHTFSVGLDYLKLQTAVGDITHAAYSELNGGEDIAVEALSQATTKFTSETADFILGKLSSFALKLGGIGELLPSDVQFAVDKIVDRCLAFAVAKVQGIYYRIVYFWYVDLDNRTFNQRRGGVSDAETSLLEFAQEQTFTWSPAWQAELARRQTLIENKNETVGGLGINLNFEPPFVHLASLTEMNGQFNWVKDTLLPIVEEWSWIILVLFLFLMLVAVVIVALPTASIPPAFLVVVVFVAKAVAALLMIFVKMIITLQTSKIVIAIVILSMGAMGIAGTAEEIVSPAVVIEHQDAMDYLQQQIGGVVTSEQPMNLELSAATNEHGAVLSAQLGSTGGTPWLETQLFRGDGRLLDIVDHGIIDGSAILDTSWHLPTGPYWAVAVAHGGQTIQTQRATFLVESPAVTLELTLSEQQLQLGEPLHASLIITNQDPITGTGKLELTAMTLDGEGLQVWFPELGPDESETYDYSFVPQVEAGYVLRTSVGNDMGTIARVDRGFSVGEAPAVALTGKTQPTYQPGDNVILPVTAVNAGTQPMTTTLLLNTYNRNNSFTLVYSTTQAITLDSGASSSLELMMLPLAIPGSYSTHLLLGDRLYSTYDYLVTAEGSLFTVVRSEPIAISGSEPVTLIVDVQNEVYAAIDADVSAELLTPMGEVINVPLSQISTGLYQAVYVPDSPGTYTVKVIASKPNYAGTSSTTFFTVDEASLLLVDTQGQLTLNQTSPITITIVNEKIIPVPDTSVLFTSINGILVGQTDGSGVMNLVLRPVTTDTIQVRVEKLGFASTLLSLPVVAITDTVAPALSMILPEFTNQVSLTFNGVTESNAMVTINDQAVLVTSNGTYTASVDLVEGANLISGVAIDPVGNRTVVTDIVTLETVAPGLTWTWPPDLLVTASPIVTVTGTTESDVGLMINNLVIDVQPDGSFSAWVLLDQAGANTITVMVADRAGNETQEERVVWLAVEHRIYLPLTTRDSP